MLPKRAIQVGQFSYCLSSLPQIDHFAIFLSKSSLSLLEMKLKCQRRWHQKNSTADWLNKRIFSIQSILRI